MTSRILPFALFGLVLSLSGCAQVLGVDDLAAIEAEARIGVAEAQAHGMAEAARYSAEASVSRAAVWAGVTPEITLLIVAGAVAIVVVAGWWWYQRRRLELQVELARSGLLLPPFPPRPALPPARGGGATATVYTLPAVDDPKLLTARRKLLAMVDDD